MDNQIQKYTIDFKDVKGIYDMFEIISTAMDFPDYFGNNWDAFWDCLTDMYGSKVNIVFEGLEKLRKVFGEEAENDIAILKRILYRFKHNYDNEFCDDITIKIQDGKDIYYIENWSFGLDIKILFMTVFNKNKNAY